LQLLFTARATYSAHSRMPKAESPNLKSSETIKALVSPDLRAKLKAALEENPHYRGNFSEFITECARAFIAQSRKEKTRPLYPVEFLEEPK
jgi:hypothetical protein